MSFMMIIDNNNHNITNTHIHNSSNNNNIQTQNFDSFFEYQKNTLI